jgi:hypothetical protein
MLAFFFKEKAFARHLKASKKKYSKKKLLHARHLKGPARKKYLKNNNGMLAILDMEHGKKNLHARHFKVRTR